MDKFEGIIQLTNYKDHPTNNLYKVFFFTDKVHAEYFEQLIIDKEIPFEKDVDETGKKGKPLYLYGIKKDRLDEAHECNHLTSGNFRKPIFGRYKIKYFFLIIILVVAATAVIGYMISDKENPDFFDNPENDNNLFDYYDDWGDRWNNGVSKDTITQN